MGLLFIYNKIHLVKDYLHSEYFMSFLYLLPPLKDSRYSEQVGGVKRTAEPELKRARTISSQVFREPPPNAAPSSFIFTNPSFFSTVLPFYLSTHKHLDCASRLNS